MIKRTFTIKSPFVMLRPTDRTHGRPMLLTERCISCGTCAKMCPPEAIDLIDTKAGLRPRIDFGRCIISCQLCVHLCPTAALVTTRDYELAEYRRRPLIYSPKKLGIVPDVRKGRRMLVPKFYKRRGVSHVPVVETSNAIGSRARITNR